MKLTPVGKSSITAFLMVAAFTSGPLVQILLCMIVGTLGLASPVFKPFSPGGMRVLRRFLVYVAGFAFAVVLFNGLLLPGGKVLITVGPYGVHEAGLSFGFRAASRVALLSTALVTFFASTPLREFATLLEWFRVPRVLVSLILLSIYFIERMPARMAKIYLAQESRGAPVRDGLSSRVRAFVSILSPLVISSLIESLDRGIALELRGFHQSTSRTHAQFRLSTAERLTAIMFLSLATLLVFWRLLDWAFLS